MSYESFRSDLFNTLSNSVYAEDMENILYLIDKIAVNYNFSRLTTEITPYNGIPDVVKMYIASKATESLKKRTLQNYLDTLRNMFLSIHKPFDQVTANDVRVYLTNYQLKRGITDRTKNSMRVQIKDFYAWCLNEELINKNPMLKLLPIKYHKTQRYIIPRIELEMMRFNCKTLREKAIIDILYSSGIRVSELCALKKDDITWSTRAINIEHGKGDKQRTSYINSEAVVSLQAYLNSRTDDCPYVIVNTHGEKKHGLDKRSIEKKYIKLLKELAFQARKSIHIISGIQLQHI